MAPKCQRRRSRAGIRIRRLTAMGSPLRDRPIAYVIGLAGLLLVLRLPFMAASVDDLDSTNFVFGVVDYSPPAHRPHPPGFPVFIGAAKVLTGLGVAPVRALTLLSAVAGALAAIPLVLLVRSIVGRETSVHAAILMCFTPIVWFVSVRPMSDAFGCLIGLTAVAMLAAGLDDRRPRNDWWWMAGAVMSGLAIGARLQLSLLVLPLFLVGWLKERRKIVASPLLLAGAVLCWWTPMVWASGGPGVYLKAFERTMTEALRWEPFVSAPSTVRALRSAHDVFIAPWHSAWLALPVWAFAIAGVATLRRHGRHALGMLALVFGPYALFTLLVHNTTAVRYTIPALPLIAVLAASGLDATRRIARPLPAVIVTVYVAMSAALTMPALFDYRHEASPPIRALSETHRGADRDVVVSGSHVFDRYLSFAPPSFRILSAAGESGWPRVVQYWLRGGDTPVDFLLMPGESLRGLIAPDAVEEIGTWRWAPRIAPFMAGERPNIVRRFRLTSPAWILQTTRTPRGRATLELFVRSDRGERSVLIQGRTESSGPQRFSLRAAGELLDQQAETSTFLLHTTVNGGGRYTDLTVNGSTSFQIARVVVAKPTETVFQPTRGFRRATAGEGFHWLDPLATVIAHVPPAGATLRLQGELPPDVSSPDTSLAIRWDGQTVASTPLTSPFDMAVMLRPGAQAWSALTLETTSQGRPAPFSLRLNDISLDNWSPEVSGYD